MKRIVLLLSLLLNAALWAQPRIQIEEGQKLEVSCTKEDEESPNRRIKLKFQLLEPSGTASEVIEVGPNPSSSQPIIPAATIAFAATEFPGANMGFTTVEKEVVIQLSKKVIDKPEKVYLYLQGKPGMGVAELTITCEKKK